MTGGAPGVSAQLSGAAEGLRQQTEVQALQEWSAAALQASSSFNLCNVCCTLPLTCLMDHACCFQQPGLEEVCVSHQGIAEL